MSGAEVCRSRHAIRRVLTIPGNDDMLSTVPKTLMDFVQLCTWAVAAIGGLVAAFKAVREMRENREQRQRELSWRQASAAKELIDSLQADARANDAMTMLDWSGRPFMVGDERFVVTTEGMVNALRTDQARPFDGEEVFIRDCFDHLFFHLDRIGHFVHEGLVRFEDVGYPLEYYVRQMADRVSVFTGFMSAYGYRRALQLLERLGLNGGQPQLRGPLSVAVTPTLLGSQRIASTQG
jgi:hypothetical protein